MENIVVLNEQQFEDIIYRTVSRCLAEKNIGNFEDSPVEERATMIAAKSAVSYTSLILPYGE